LAALVCILDNLRAHHSIEVRNASRRNRATLLFNGNCSSQLFPIEIVCAWSKRLFAKLSVYINNFKDETTIPSLVRTGMIQVKARSLERHIHSCLIIMEWTLVDLEEFKI